MDLCIKPNMIEKQKKSRVLFPYNRDRVGGSYISSAQLARYLHEESEFEPIIALPKKARNQYLFNRYGLHIEEHLVSFPSKPLRYRVFRGPVNLFFRWLNTFRAWRFLGRLRPDFVHVHDDNSFNTWGRAAKWRGVRTIWHVRLEDPKPPDVHVSGWANHVVFISQGCRSRFNQMPDVLKRSSTIYNGIDLDEFAPPDENAKRKILSDLNLSKKNVICGFVGNLVERKRPEWAYHAMASLNKSGIPAQLICIGEDRGSPPFYMRFDKLSAADGLQGKVTFLGPRDDVNRLMGAFDVLLVPSRPHGEPFSRVLAEACAMSIPVVASAGVGALELLEPGKDCVVVSEDHVEAFARAAVELCSKPALMKKVGMAARMSAEAAFSYRRMGAETVTLYRRLLL